MNFPNQICLFYIKNCVIVVVVVVVVAIFNVRIFGVYVSVN